MLTHARARLLVLETNAETSIRTYDFDSDSATAAAINNVSMYLYHSPLLTTLSERVRENKNIDLTENSTTRLAILLQEKRRATFPQIRTQANPEIVVHIENRPPPPPFPLSGIRARTRERESICSECIFALDVHDTRFRGGAETPRVHGGTLFY